jgi:hypothetical protein
VSGVTIDPIPESVRRLILSALAANRRHWTSVKSNVEHGGNPKGDHANGKTAKAERIDGGTTSKKL